MKRHANALRLLGLLGMVLGTPVALYQAAGTARAENDAAIVAIYTLPDIAVSTYQNETLPDHPIADDWGMLLGGIGSDLWHAPGDPPDEFWVVTDRGPNVEIEVDDEDRRIFPVPDFTPLILHIRAEGDALTIVDAIPIVNRDGEPVTGLPNLKDIDERPYDVTGEGRLDNNQDGLDVEGMVRTSEGEFWLAEEYRPSLVKVDAAGQVLTRYVPEGTDLSDARYPVEDTLPAIYGMRKENRGFEGLALSGDGNTLYAVVQSPLSNPDEDAGEESRNGRILAVDTASGEPTGEYIYRFEDVAAFDDNDQDEMKLSGLVWLDETTLLALERTDEIARLYSLDLADASDILSTDWDDPETSPALEELDDPAAEELTALSKTLFLDLGPLNLPEKIEGVAVLDEVTVAVMNDNDFAIGEFRSGRHEGTGVTSQMLVIRASAGR